MCKDTKNFWKTNLLSKKRKFHGRFCSMTNTKLFVVSTHAFSGQVKKEADRHLIGLILVSPNHEITEDSFVLPRTPGSQHDEEVLWHMMLVGTNDMTKPILVYDSGRIDDSLSFASWPASSISTSSSGNTLTSSFSSGDITQQSLFSFATRKWVDARSLSQIPNPVATSRRRKRLIIWNQAKIPLPLHQI